MDPFPMIHKYSRYNLYPPSSPVTFQFQSAIFPHKCPLRVTCPRLAPQKALEQARLLSHEPGEHLMILLAPS